MARRRLPGRDAKGRFLPGNRVGFLPGNPGGPGRPLGSRALSEIALLRLLVSCVNRDPDAISDEQVKALVDAAFKTAIEGRGKGSTKMMRFLLRAMLGDDWGRFMDYGETVYYSKRIRYPSGP